MVIVMTTSILLKNLKFLIQNLLCFKRGEKMEEEIDKEIQEEQERQREQGSWGNTESGEGEWQDQRVSNEDSGERSSEQFSSEKSPDSQG
jgi:low affinity Fe/Cu permease